MLNFRLEKCQLHQGAAFGPGRFLGVFATGLLLSQLLQAAGPTSEVDASEHEQSSALGTPASEEAPSVSKSELLQEATPPLVGDGAEESERLSDEAPTPPAVSKAGADVSLGM
jgi:hypothetical protein